MIYRHEGRKNGHQGLGINHSGLCNQLGDEPAVLRELDVLQLDRGDSLAEDVSGGDPAPESDAREQADLLRRISSVHVEGRVRLRETLLLSLAERFLEREPVLAHAREDVVGRPVHDADETGDPVSQQALLQDLDDRDPPAHGGLELQLDPVGRGKGEKLPAVDGEKSLVRGDDVLPAAERIPDERQRAVHPAGQLDHDRHVGVLHDLPPPLHNAGAGFDLSFA